MVKKEKKLEVLTDEEFTGREMQLERDTDAGLTIKNLDSKENLNKNTRLHDTEIMSLLAIEGLQDFGVLDPVKITIHQKFKELSISKDGKGRSEKVDLFRGEREAKQGGGFFSKMFSKREEK